jgi:uncharacterized protein YbjT (DUF2867 family)
MPDTSPDDRTLPGTRRRCLVTGATGYVGGRLAPALVTAGFDVTVLVRRPERVRDLPWASSVRLCAGDAEDRAALRDALDGVHTAFYLLHSIGTGTDFVAREERTAIAFAEEALAAGVSQIVYLGGLANDGALSAHLSSRVAVGQALRSTGVPVLELRAGVILGSGSASFEMLRYLTERLPVMVAPRWIDNRIQPIAIADVVSILGRAAALPRPVDAVCDIGGPDVLTYRQMMTRYAQIAGLRRRWIVPVGVLTPKLSSHWVGLVTPVPASLAKPLVRSLINEAFCDPAHPLLPELSAGDTISFDDAVRRALVRQVSGEVQTRWSDANGVGAVDWALPSPADPDWSGGTTLSDSRRRTTDASAASLWAAVCCIGGDTGWYGSDWAWQARGFIDRIFGGVGLRRGRRDPHHLRVGDAVDFWRVEVHEPQQHLRLRAEMRLPGDAWLEFTIVDHGTHREIRQDAWFHPRGLWGLAYWYAVAPFHTFVFPGMLRGIVADAEGRDAAQQAPAAA